MIFWQISNASAPLGAVSGTPKGSTLRDFFGGPSGGLRGILLEEEVNVVPVLYFFLLCCVTQAGGLLGHTIPANFGTH